MDLRKKKIGRKCLRILEEVEEWMDPNPRVGKKALSCLRVSRCVSRCVLLPRLTSESQPPCINNQIKQANKFQTEQKPFRESPQSQPDPYTWCCGLPSSERDTMLTPWPDSVGSTPGFSTEGCSLESCRNYLLSHWPLRWSLYKTWIMSCNFSPQTPFKVPLQLRSTVNFCLHLNFDTKVTQLRRSRMEWLLIKPLMYYHSFYEKVKIVQGDLPAPVSGAGILSLDHHARRIPVLAPLVFHLSFPPSLLDCLFF